MRPGDPGADRQFAALGDLLLYFSDRGPVRPDPRTYALWVIATYIGDVDNFELTPTQRELIARLGTRAEKAPTPDETLTELSVVGIADLAEALQQKIGDANRERNEADEKARLNASAVAGAKKRETELNEAREVIAGLTGELEGETSSEGDPRRDGPLHHGSGKLGIGWQDADGKPRWKRSVTRTMRTNGTTVTIRPDGVHEE
jgi:hypothetical protein